MVKDKNLTTIAKRNMQNVVPLYYEMKKAKGGMLTPEVLYEGMAKAYTTGNIGPISNNITKIWNCGKEIGEEQLNVIRWLCMENNFVIDAAKTLYTPTRPKEIDVIIKSYTKAKVPNFFQYAKDKDKKQVEPTNSSPMNRLSNFIPDSKMKFSKSISKFDYRVLMNQSVDFTIGTDNPVIKSYDYWNGHMTEFNAEDQNKGLKNQDMYKYIKMRENVLKEVNKDIDYVVNSLVAYLYTVRKTSVKKGLWDCFGDVILKNIKVNLEGAGSICPVCGKRFKPKRSTQTYCSEQCYTEGHRRDMRGRYFSTTN